MEGYKVGEHPRIVALLKGVFNRNPPKRTLLPPWDLRVVLKHIQNHPFEPLNQVDLKFKTSCLLLLLEVELVIFPCWAINNRFCGLRKSPQGFVSLLQGLGNRIDLSIFSAPAL